MCGTCEWEDRVKNLNGVSMYVAAAVREKTTQSWYPATRLVGMSVERSILFIPPRMPSHMQGTYAIGCNVSLHKLVHTQK